MRERIWTNAQWNPLRELYHSALLLNISYSLLLLLDDWGRLHDLLAEDVSLDEVGKPRFQFVRDEAFCRDGEDLYGDIYQWEAK